MSAVVSPWTPGANSAPPEPIAGFAGAYFLLNTTLSLAKNNAVLSLGQTDGHCYHDSLKNIPKNPVVWKTAVNLVTSFSGKLLKIVAKL